MSAPMSESVTDINRATFGLLETVTRSRVLDWRCEQCGKPWPGFGADLSKRRRFCSSRCAAAARRQRQRKWRDDPEPRECGGCGSEFRPKRRDAMYCSVACKQRAYRRRTTASSGGQRATLDRPSASCP
jgi:hypothetical protein